MYHKELAQRPAGGEDTIDAFGHGMGGPPSPRHSGRASPRFDPEVLPDAGRELALANLQQLGHYLGIRDGLVFDSANTCILGRAGEPHGSSTILVTYDPETARLYLYATLLNAIPATPTTRLALYELLLEGSLLGREMAGGGVGMSLKNDFILMATSVDLRTSTSIALVTLFPRFQESLERWRGKIRQLLNSHHALEAENVPSSGPDALHGGHRPPYLGLEVTDGVLVDGTFSPYTDGVVVVASKGPSAAAGILPNDVIRFVNSIRVSDLRDFQNVTSDLIAGDPFRLTIDRRGQVIVVDVDTASGERPRSSGRASYRNNVRLVPPAHPVY
eukprot:NODE_2369_length_1137_cov_5.701287_g1967_i0.p1 GENE.NODE_2369_length_1137_cov_5.701287_g1967_i0~~NODE_2369_length_1137_cov_5.701287_g1967_i0.p1  ORF type:complete len:360 (+),score=38.98 NODE_2369_length_1137_cov_5.701287_g1967_i0:90-1082(+)